MSHIRLDPGVYTNVFPVRLPKEPVLVMTAPRACFPDLRQLREKIRASEWRTRVCAAGAVVYGYGPDMSQLAGDGFTEERVLLMENPQLATRLIIDGIVDAGKSNGYGVRFGKGRPMLIQSNPLGKGAGGKVQVYLGFDLRGVHFRSEAAPECVFGLVVDVTWALRDDTGEPLSMRRVAEYNATALVAQIQGEYLPGGTRINSEVARQRLQEYILPFVQAHAEFALPCGGSAQLLPEPIRVVLGS